MGCSLGDRTVSTRRKASSRDVLDRSALLRSVAAVLAGTPIFLYGYLGHRGPGFLGPGWLMIIGGALVGYSIANLLRLTLVGKRLDLSPQELERWGPTLEEATPELLDAIARKEPMAKVAATLERERGLPPEVTLKYVIALGRYQEEERAAKDLDEAANARRR